MVNGPFHLHIKSTDLLSNSVPATLFLCRWKNTMLTQLQLWIIRWWDFKIRSNIHRKRRVSESQQSDRWQPLELVFLKLDWFSIQILGATTASILGIHWNNLGISITSWRWSWWANWRVLHGTITDSNGLWGVEYLEDWIIKNFINGWTGWRARVSRPTHPTSSLISVSKPFPTLEILVCNRRGGRFKYR